MTTSTLSLREFLLHPVENNQDTKIRLRWSNVRTKQEERASSAVTTSTFAPTETYPERIFSHVVRIDDLPSRMLAALGGLLDDDEYKTAAQKHEFVDFTGRLSTPSSSLEIFRYMNSQKISSDRVEADVPNIANLLLEFIAPIYASLTGKTFNVSPELEAKRRIVRMDSSVSFDDIRRPALALEYKSPAVFNKYITQLMSRCNNSDNTYHRVRTGQANFENEDAILIKVRLLDAFIHVEFYLIS